MIIQDFIIDEYKFKLPVGVIDNNGTLHDTVTLKPMTGLVEERMNDPKIKNNGGKIITELIYGVVESIGTLPRVNKDLIRDLSSIDRDFIVLANSMVSFDKMENPLEFEAKCSCGGVNTLMIMLPELPCNPLEDKHNREITFKLKDGIEDTEGTVHKDITIMLPTGRVQEAISPILMQNMASAKTMTFQLITKNIGTLPFINLDIFKKMTRRDRKLIESTINDVNAGINLTINSVCNHCGNDLTAFIPIEALMGE